MQNKGKLGSVCITNKETLNNKFCVIKVFKPLFPLTDSDFSKENKIFDTLK